MSATRRSANAFDASERDLRAGQGLIDLAADIITAGRRFDALERQATADAAEWEARRLAAIERHHAKRTRERGL